MHILEEKHIRRGWVCFLSQCVTTPQRNCHFKSCSKQLSLHDTALRGFGPHCFNNECRVSILSLCQIQFVLITEGNVLKSLFFFFYNLFLHYVSVNINLVFNTTCSINSKDLSEPSLSHEYWQAQVYTIWRLKHSKMAHSQKNIVGLGLFFFL